MVQSTVHQKREGKWYPNPGMIMPYILDLPPPIGFRHKNLFRILFFISKYKNDYVHECCIHLECGLMTFVLPGKISLNGGRKMIWIIAMIL